MVIKRLASSRSLVVVQGAATAECCPPSGSQPDYGMKEVYLLHSPPAGAGCELHHRTHALPLQRFLPCRREASASLLVPGCVLRMSAADGPSSSDFRTG
jgi:hypothetical protein